MTVVLCKVYTNIWVATKLSDVNFVQFKYARKWIIVVCKKFRIHFLSSLEYMACTFLVFTHVQSNLSFLNEDLPAFEFHKSI